MNTAPVEKIANAVLYEGYILYPYRASAVKNRQRFNFGVVYPRLYSVAKADGDAWTTQTECPVEGDARIQLDVKARFLQLASRAVAKPLVAAAVRPGGDLAEFNRMSSFGTGQETCASCQEAVEREIAVSGLELAELTRKPLRREFRFAAEEKLETLRDTQGNVAGLIIRRQREIAGAVEVAAKRERGNCFRVTVRLVNLSSIESDQSRDEALLQSMISAHTVLCVKGGAFVSLLDPPEPFKELAASCRNFGTYPVLTGEEGRRDTMLSSPIILYDYPQVAPESAGDFFDGTEIDEMLALRVMTLTDDEKREIRHGDERARRILEITEALPPEHLMKLHGALRGLSAAPKPEI